MFSECKEIVERKYPNLQEEHFAPLISELYEEAVVKHIATRSKGAELDYLKTLVDILLHRFVPEQTFSCVSGRFLLREILAVQILEPLIKDITNAHFVNEIVIDILEPSIPLDVILQNWEEAMKEIEEEGEHGVPIVPSIECDISSPETTYESTHEIIHEIKISPSKKRTRKSRKKKTSKRIFQTGGNSSSDHSDIEQPTKDIIRFDKLDIRTSNPVYGSTSARDHEKSNTQLLSPVDNNKTLDRTLEPIDSGRSSLGNPLNRTNIETSGNFHDVSMVEKQDWTVCPRPDAAVFRQPSFSEMPLNQDDLTERIKAKVNSADISSMVRTSMACLDPCSPRKLAADQEDLNVMDRPQSKSIRTSRVLSIDGSVTMNFSSRKTSQMKREEVEETIENEANENASDACVKVHSSGTDGAFYVIAPSCPTCIEMTLLASPFEIEKAQVVLNEKERSESDKIIEHECGLSSEHYCNPQAETESINVEPLVESQLVVSCSEEGVSDYSISSGTLLASGETFEDSRVTDTERSSSFDNITDVSFHSSACNIYEGDQNTTLSYDDEVAALKKNKKRAKRRKLSRAASHATFKTAIEDSVINESTRRRSISTNSLEKNKNIFVKLFKKGARINNKKSLTTTTDGIGEQSTVSAEDTVKRKRHKHQKRRKKINDEELKIETSSISTSVTKFNSLPENPSSGPSHWNSKQASYMKDLVEEVGYEVDEDEDHSTGNLTLISQVDPLSKEITVTDKDLLDVKSVKSQEGTTPSLQSYSQQQQQQDPNRFIPIYEGQVIMPHPSKLPATWLYPIQMISIPSTEVALEKGWEPGINKYTLYGIHVSYLTTSLLFFTFLMPQEMT